MFRRRINKKYTLVSICLYCLRIMDQYGNCIVEKKTPKNKKTRMKSSQTVEYTHGICQECLERIYNIKLSG